MKRPLIGINTDYETYRGRGSSDADFPQGCGGKDVHFRDSYWVYTRYVEVICDAGGLPLLVPCLGNEDLLKEYLERVNGFLFIGGADYPPESYGEVPHPKTKVCDERRSAADFELAKLVLARRIPLLAICGGSQLISIASGGKLIQHLKTARSHKGYSLTMDREHFINIVPDTILARIFASTRISVNSAHHQAVHPEHLGPKLQVTAQADDGVVEAIESGEERFLLGVQWHPERIRDGEHKKKLLGAFVKACR